MDSGVATSIGDGDNAVISRSVDPLPPATTDAGTVAGPHCAIPSAPYRSLGSRPFDDLRAKAGARMARKYEGALRGGIEGVLGTEWYHDLDTEPRQTL